MAKKKLGYPSTLACERKIAPSDGVFYAANWEERKDPKKRMSLDLREKAVRGTKANYSTKEAEKVQPNPQTIDVCTLPPGKDTLIVEFTVKILSGLESTAMCDNPEFEQNYRAFVETYRDKTAFRELSRRYAQNLANGRFLWRNRIGAEAVGVDIRIEGQEAPITFDCSDYSLKTFDDEPDESLSAVAASIADALAGKQDYAMLHVTAYARLGDGQEVFPSQEMVLEKSDKDKSRILYSSFGQAAMHSQKIGNAIRTIDTWYAEYPETRMPIAAECYGAVTTRGIAYREGKDSFYTLFENAVLNGKDISEEEADFVIAILVRGGVFGR